VDAWIGTGRGWGNDPLLGGRSRRRRSSVRPYNSDRLITESVLNAIIVLMVATSILGPALSERFGIYQLTQRADGPGGGAGHQILERRSVELTRFLQREVFMFRSYQGGLLLLAGMLVGSTGFAAEQSTGLREAVGQRMEQRTSMPVLKGNVWKAMSADEKIAFLWGSAHIIAIERELAGRFPELDQDDFSKKVAEGMPKMGMYELAAKVDQYYGSHPEQTDTPVLAVIWQLLAAGVGAACSRDGRDLIPAAAGRGCKPLPQTRNHQPARSC
jgi:hypothetical protein